MFCGDCGKPWESLVPPVVVSLPSPSPSPGRPRRHRWIILPIALLLVVTAVGLVVLFRKGVLPTGIRFPPEANSAEVLQHFRPTRRGTSGDSLSCGPEANRRPDSREADRGFRPCLASIEIPRIVAHFGEGILALPGPGFCGNCCPLLERDWADRNSENI